MGEEAVADGYILLLDLVRLYRSSVRLALCGDEGMDVWTAMRCVQGGAMSQTANVRLLLSPGPLNSKSLVFIAAEDLEPFSQELVWSLAEKVEGCDEHPEALPDPLSLPRAAKSPAEAGTCKHEQNATAMQSVGLLWKTGEQVAEKRTQQVSEADGHSPGAKKKLRKKAATVYMLDMLYIYIYYI